MKGTLKFRIIKKNKKADMFQWMFALLVGGIILFLALFATFQYIQRQSYQQGTFAAKEFEVLLNPLETSFIAEQAAILPFAKDSQMLMSCNAGEIGSETIKFKQISGIGKQYQDFGSAIAFNNKYIFSQAQEKGKTLYLFSKKLYMPWNFDLIYASLGKYCFIDAPEIVESELKLLNISNVKIVSNEKNCVSGDVKVKFSLSCDYDCEKNLEGNVIVNNEERYVKSLSLAFAAAFSSSDIYYCNLRRIAYRAGLLAELYEKKAGIIAQEGCSIENIKPKLTAFKSLAQKVANEKEPENDFFRLVILGEELDSLNSDLVCKLW